MPITAEPDASRSGSEAPIMQVQVQGTPLRTPSFVRYVIRYVVRYGYRYASSRGGLFLFHRAAVAFDVRTFASSLLVRAFVNSSSILGWVY